jgi:glycerol uptake facilitator-like aquaporin
LTDTFSGIRPSDVPGFIVAEIAGAAAAVILCRWLLPDPAVVNERAPLARLKTG